MATNEELAQNAISDIQKFVKDVDEALVKRMVKSYAIVMRKADSRTVACSDPKELATVRTNFMRKKLAIEGSDEELDLIINDVIETMSASRMKQRLSFYYLIVQKTNKQAVFA